MNDSRAEEQDVGLCARCAHARSSAAAADRASTCAAVGHRSAIPKYPPLPGAPLHRVHARQTSRKRIGRAVAQFVSIADRYARYRTGSAQAGRLAARRCPADTARRLARPERRPPRSSAAVPWCSGIRRTRPGTPFAKKLDAIDTDQITPATDCVSESLETLDERWKAGSFRYLMPDFRARVHRGENFVIAGDRFAIGSSREMSPAGLKGVAEEAGLQMVIVCGNNMGDIFRRNSFNLGLHVVQSPEAVADAQDGDELTFDPVTRELRNVSKGKTYQPVPLSAKEEEIRRSGGIFEVGRREFRKSVITRPSIDWAEPSRRRGDDDDRADRLGAPRRQGPDAGGSDARHDAARLRRPAAGLRRHGAVLDPHVQSDHRRPRRSIRGRRRSPTTTSSSLASTPTRSRRRSAASSRGCTASSGRTTRRQATASFISTFPNRGW